MQPPDRSAGGSGAHAADPGRRRATGVGGADAAVRPGHRLRPRPADAPAVLRRLLRRVLARQDVGGTLPSRLHQELQPRPRERLGLPRYAALRPGRGELLMEPVTRYGRDYWPCPDCPYGSFDRAYTEAHLREHEPRPSLDDYLAAATTATVQPAAIRAKKKET